MLDRYGNDRLAHLAFPKSRAAEEAEAAQFGDQIRGFF
jgi:hypothetical protein